MQSIREGISRVDYWSLEQNYNHAKRIEEGSFLTSRIHALAISPICAAGLALKLVLDSGKLLNSAVTSIANRRLESGNIQLGAVYAAEAVRNLAGAIFGSVMGVLSPQMARTTFLVNTDEMLRRVLNPEKTSQLYALTKGFVDFCDRHELEFRMTSGTFLGAVRHEGVIPWDDDVDLFLQPEHGQKFRDLIADGTFSDETGFATIWDDTTKGWRVFYLDGDVGKAILLGAKFPFVDIFETRWDSRDRVVYESPAMYGWAPQEYYTRQEWEECKEYRFGPLKIKGPANPKPFFNRAFGVGADKFAYLIYQHDDFSVRKWPQRVFVSTTCGAMPDPVLYGKLVRAIPGVN